MIPSGRGNSLALSAVALGHFMVDLYQNALPPLLPMISVRLGLSLAACGSIVSLGAIAASLSQPLFGYLSDRGLSNAVLIPCVAWAALIMSLLPWAPSYWTIAAVAMIGGLGNALYHPQGSVATAVTAGSRRGLGIAIYVTAGNLGYTLSPLFVLPLVAMTRFPVTLMLLLVPAAISVPFMVAAGVQRIPALRTDPTHKTDLRSLFDQRAGRAMIRLSAVVAARSWGIYSLVVFVPHLLIGRGYGELEAGGILTAFLMAGTITGMFGGALSDRWGRSRTIGATTLVGAILLIGGLVFPGAWAIGVLVLGSGVLQAAFPAAVAYAQELTPDHAALASGLMMGFGWGLGGLGATITGLLADRLGIVTALVFVLVLLIPIGLWSFTWRNPTGD